MKLHQVHRARDGQKKYEVKREINKKIKRKRIGTSTKQKNKPKQGKAGERKKYDNLCGLGKGFLKVASPVGVCVRGQFSGDE